MEVKSELFVCLDLDHWVQSVPILFIILAPLVLHLDTLECCRAESVCSWVHLHILGSARLGAIYKLICSLKLEVVLSLTIVVIDYFYIKLAKVW